MENTTALPNGTNERQHGERRKEQRAIEFMDRRTFWRRAADRMERAGRPVTALFFNNEAALVESESERHQVRGAFAVNGEMQ